MTIINQIASGATVAPVALTGDAIVSDVLAGKTFYNTDPETKLTGTLVPGGGGSGAPYQARDTSTEVTVVAGPSAHTKGAWTEILAATTAAAGTAMRVRARFVGAASTNTATLIDVAFGASGSEVAVVSNIAVGGASQSYGVEFMLPIAVPIGTRISVRNQSITPRTALVRVDVLDGGSLDPPTSLDALGTSTATSAGTNITTAWTEVVASTAAAYQGFVVVPSLNKTLVTTTEGYLSVAKGAAASEEQIGDIYLQVTSSEMVVSSCGGAAWMMPGQPAGTRLSAKRHDSTCDVTIIGIPTTP